MPKRRPPPRTSPPALLAKAFRGERVLQNPKGEPAAELLCSLQVEREFVTATKTER